MKKQTFLNPSKSALQKEILDIVRGASGGFLFGIPLLYTMEVWQVGSSTEPPVLLAILALTYIVVFFFNRSEGFRRKKRRTLRSAVLESIEALAIGLGCATLILILIQEINYQTPLNEALGKIIFESVPFSMGVSLSRLILSADQAKNNSSTPKKSKSKLNNVFLKETLSDISATLIGAIIIAFNIAPTDEVTILAASASPPWLIAYIFASLLISYGIVFIAGFINQEKRSQQQGLFQSPETETIISYLISLFSSVLMLWFFQKLSLSDPWFLWLRSTLVLGLPATIGGAAGRLAV